MPFGFDRDRDRDDRDDRGGDYSRREFMREEDYRRRFEHDRERGDVQRMFRDRDDDEMRHGHPSLRDDYNRERDWVSRSDEDRRYFDRGRDDDRRYSERGRDDGRRYMSRDDDRGYLSRGPSYDAGYRSREDERYGRDDRRYMSRDDRGYAPQRHEQRDYGDRGGYGGYGNYGHRSSSRDTNRGREDEPRRWTSDRDERDRDQYGQREYQGGGRDDDYRRRY